MQERVNTVPRTETLKANCRASDRGNGEPGTTLAGSQWAHVTQQGSCQAIERTEQSEAAGVAEPATIRNLGVQNRFERSV